MVTAEERVKIGAVKPIRRCVADFASIYDVLHSARRELLFVSPYISPEFIAILDFLSTRAPIRGVVAELQSHLRRRPFSLICRSSHSDVLLDSRGSTAASRRRSS